MNLIIFLDTDQISLFKEENEKVSLISDNYLYFFFDTKKDKIMYNVNYKIFTIEEKDYFYGDILSKIQNDEKIIIDENSYNPDFFISELLNTELKNLSFDNHLISFSNNISQQLSEILTKFFMEKFNNVSVIENFTSLAVKNYLKSNQIFSAQKDIFILSVSQSKLISVQAEFDGSNISLITNDVIGDIAFYPYGYELAKKIYTDIKRIYKPNSDQSDICNTNFIYWRINNKAEKIINTPKEHVSVSTRLLNDNKRYVVNIKPNEIKISTKVFLKSFIEKLVSQANVNKNARLILIGDFFNNKLIFNELEGNFKNLNKLDFESVFETRNSDFEAEIDEYSTMFLSEDERLGTEETNNFQKATTLDLNLLQIGMQIKLTNYDSGAGKGYSNQHLEYLGDNKFVVIESTRSLKTGDIAVAEENIWHQGIKIIFRIQRGGKDYGRFQTREIQSIEYSE
ncbi:MAG: hypothetical protein JXR68_03410 [Bacteroidales bacterium]|nr:hypothetical protein [Bacteroidales bacterium]